VYFHDWNIFPHRSLHLFVRSSLTESTIVAVCWSMHWIRRRKTSSCNVSLLYEVWEWLCHNVNSRFFGYQWWLITRQLIHWNRLFRIQQIYSSYWHGFVRLWLYMYAYFSFLYNCVLTICHYTDMLCYGYVRRHYNDMRIHMEQALRMGAGHPLPPSFPLSFHFLIFCSIFTFSLFPFLIRFTYFLLLSIPSLSTRIVPLCFQAWRRRRRPNLGLDCCVYCVLSVVFS